MLVAQALEMALWEAVALQVVVLVGKLADEQAPPLLEAQLVLQQALEDLQAPL